MSNSLLTPTVISNELLMRFKNKLSFASGASHEYDERFDKIGDTYKLRVPTKFVANDGADISSAIQDVIETSKDLVINKQKNVAFEFSAKDLTLTIDRFAERYLDSAAVALANIFDTDGLTLAYQATPNIVGTAGEALNSAAKVLAAGAKLDNNACPVDDNRSLVINPSAQASLVDALKGLFQDSTNVAKQYRSGRMGTALGFDFAMSQNIRSHTVGAWAGTVLVKTTVAAAAGETDETDTVIVDGLDSATAALKKGDKITIANVYDVNPVSGDALPTLKQFTITADVSAVANEATITVYPAFRNSGARKTVSALPQAEAAVTIQATAATAFPMNMAYHKHAFTYATVPLELPKGVHFGARSIDKDSGLSIRIISDYNITYDKFVTRCDIAYGWAARRPEWATVVLGL